VVSVADGDTLTVLDETQRQYKVRLSGIDAPERRQAYGERAKQHLSALAHGKSARIVWDRNDRYGRLIARVLVPECVGVRCSYTLDVGLAQIKAGLAWHYKQYAKQQPVGERWSYAANELEARARRDGLWRDADPVPPWHYRKPPVS
jgi:endonuclease YncB( thermonuclease family)